MNSTETTASASSIILTDPAILSFAASHPFLDFEKFVLFSIDRYMEMIASGNTGGGALGSLAANTEFEATRRNVLGEFQNYLRHHDEVLAAVHTLQKSAQKLCLTATQTHLERHFRVLFARDAGGPVTASGPNPSNGTGAVSSLDLLALRCDQCSYVCRSKKSLALHKRHCGRKRARHESEDPVAATPSAGGTQEDDDDDDDDDTAMDSESDQGGEDEADADVDAEELMRQILREDGVDPDQEDI